MLTYLDSNNLLPSCQSGFRKGHSTESLLLHLLSDICGAMDKTQLTLLALFDVSAAFDSVNHNIFLRRLSITFGINELPLAWITSYLSERSASVLFSFALAPYSFWPTSGMSAWASTLHSFYC